LNAAKAREERNQNFGNFTTFIALHNPTMCSNPFIIEILILIFIVIVAVPRASKKELEIFFQQIKTS
jgi:uncharacterized membrane protein